MLRPEPFNTRREPWNKGKLVGQKPPRKLNEIWSIRIRLQLANKLRGLAGDWWTPQIERQCSEEVNHDKKETFIHTGIQG